MYLIHKNVYFLLINNKLIDTCKRLINDNCSCISKCNFQLLLKYRININYVMVKSVVYIRGGGGFRD